MDAPMIYYEMPHVSEDGSVLTSYEASMICAQAVTFAELMMELELSISGPFPRRIRNLGR